MKIKIKRAVIGDEKKIVRCMKQIRQNLTNPSIYYIDEEEDIAHTLDGHGMAWIAVDKEEKIAGFLIVVIPEDEEDHLGKEKGFSKEECEKTIYMDSMAVMEDYRGYGLQRQLLKVAEQEEQLQQYIHFMATVSPENPYSLQNFQRMGYEIVCKKKKYGGLERFILYKARR